MWKPKASTQGGTAWAAVPSLPTCHMTSAALLDGVVWHLGPFRWEPEQNQRKAPCNRDIAMAPRNGT